MKYKKGLVFICLIVCLFSIAGVCASDADNSTVQAIDDSNQIQDNIILQKSNDENNSLGGGGGLLNDLQELINNNDVVNLTGDYSGGSTVSINKDLTINGNGHFLSGEDATGIFKITGGNVVINDLTFKNGKTSDNGGAICVENADSLTLNNVTFTDNYADDYGGAIYSKATINIINCTFHSNKNDDNGGAIYAEGSTYVSGSSFTDNFADNSGGAIYSKASMNIINCTFRSNKADDEYGGAIFVSVKSSTYISGSSFINNTAGVCAGAIFSAGVMNITNSTFLSNTIIPALGSLPHGGAIYVQDYTYISGSSFINNSVKQNGGAISSEYKLDIVNCSFTSNKAGEHGGAIMVKEGELTVIDSKFNFNTAGSGGAICAGIRDKVKDIQVKIINSSFIGNDVRAVYTKGSLDIINSSFINNSASDFSGGAVYCYADENVIARTSDSTNVVNSTFINNKGGGDGGAIFSNQENLIVKNSIFENNRATGSSSQGGAIYAYTITLAGTSYSYFIDNYAGKEGGAIYTRKFDSDVKYGIFINNSAKGKDGGAIYINHKNQLAFSDCTFIGNTAGDEGGAIYLDSSYSHLTLGPNNTFVNNHATTSGQDVYNCGYYDSIQNNWWGTSRPDFNKDRLVEWHKIGSDENHADSNPLKSYPSYSYLMEEIGEGGNINLKFSSYYYDYGSTIHITKSGTINGNGAVIDMRGSDFQVFDITADNVIIKNLTIKNANFKGNGAVIQFNNDGSVISCIFENNVASGDGGVILFNESGSLIDCYFVNNKAYNGGAVTFYSNGIVDACSFENNSAVDYGGAIYFKGISGTLSVANSSFVDNSAGEGAAVYSQNNLISANNNWWGSNNPDWTTLISQKMETPLSYAVLKVSANPQIMLVNSTAELYYSFYWNGTTVKANVLPRLIALSSSGGKLRDDSGYLIDGEFSTEFTSDAAGIYEITAEVDNQEIKISIDVKEGVFSTLIDEIGDGGNITLKSPMYIYDYGDTINITKSGIIDGNGAVIDMAGSDIQVFNVIADDVVIKNLIIKNANYTGNGGAVYFGNSGSLDNCTFVNNTATYGGAVYFKNSGTVDGCIFINSTAVNGSAIYFESHTCAGSISNSTFINNTADSNRILITADFKKNLITIVFKGNDNLLNAIYSNRDIEFTDVTYWGVDGINNTGKLPVVPVRSENEAGQNIITYLWISEDEIYYTVDVTDANGTIILDYPEGVEGDYTLIAYHEGDSYYSEIYNYTSNSTKTNVALVIDAPLIVEGQNATVSVQILPGAATGNVTLVDVMGENFTANVADGVAQFVIPDLPVGNYTFMVVYSGDRDFKNAISSVNMTVEPKKVVAIDAVDLITTYNSGEYLIVTVEYDGMPISDMPVGIEIGGVAFVNVTDSSGQIFIPLTGLAASAVPYGVNLTVNTEYYVGNRTVQVTIQKAAPSFGVGDIHLWVGESDRIRITDIVSDANPNFAYTSSDINVFRVVGDDVSSVGEGVANLTVTLAESENYTGLSKVVPVRVEKRTPSIDTAAEVNGTEVTISVIIRSYVGLISMDLFDSLIYLPINSSVNFTQNLAPGIYSVNITALGNDFFGSDWEVLDFTVPEPEKLNTSISAQSSVNENSVTITVDVDLNASGYVEISIEGRKYYVPVVNGTAVFINDYSSGSYVADVTYLGDEIYSTNTTKTEFSIVGPVKENTTIGLDVQTIENNVTVTVNVDKDATGLVKFEFNDKVGTVLYADVKDGQAMLSGLLEAGNYTVVATYMGDERFNTNITYKDFTVIGHIKKDTPIAAEVDVNGYKVTIAVNVDSGATGFVRLQIGDTIANVELENGTGTYITTLPAGSYNVDLTYLGDENYNTNRTKASFNIADPVKENTTISLDVETVENAAIFTVNVDKNATGLVKFEVNDEIGTVLYADVKDGQVVLSGLLEAGNYTVVATYMGDAVFNTNTISKDFKVIGHVMKDTPISAHEDVNGYKVTITVDVDSNATGFVEVKYGDTIINIALANGTGTYTTTLPAGSYNVDLTYLGDDNYNKNSTKLSFSIADPVKENTSISLDVQTIENNVTFIVNVDKDATGLVKFEVSSDEASVIYVDVKDGQAVLDVLLDAGNHTVVATYLGDDRFNTNITYKEFTVAGHVKKDTAIDVKADTNYNKVTITVNVDSNATGFVKLSFGDAVANIEIENGVATYATTLPAGSYYLQATYLGDEDYNTNSTKTAFTITEPAKQNTPISLEIAIDENEVLVNVSVDKSSSGLVKFQVFNKESGENQSVYVDVENGEAIAPLIFEKGNYTLIATYMGDAVFNTNATSQDFEIIGHVMKDTPITAQADVNGYKVTVTVDVDFDATGFVEVKYDDTIINIALTNGTGTYTATLPVGSYNVDLTYFGDENYNKNSTKLSFSIANPVKENTPITLDVETVENIVIFTVNVDKDATGLVKFEVNDEIGTVLYSDVKDGQAVLSGLLEDGNYAVVATYLGDSRFNTNIIYKEFTVIGHVKTDTPITAQADVNGYKVTISVAVDSGATGFVKLQIGDTIANVELENGIGTYTTTLPAGSYYVQATYLGDKNYNTNSTKTAFTITEAAKQNTDIGLEIAIVENEAMFNASVDKLASGLVKFQVFNKESGENQTFYMEVINGDALFSMFFEKGNYTIIATYLGDDVFNTNSTSQGFEVMGHVMKDTPITAQAAVNGYKVTVTVDVDDDATGFVEVKYDDTIINIALTNGTGTYTTTLPAGSYNVDLTYLGDENYNKNSTKLSFSIADPVKENTPISLDVATVENTAVFTVNVDNDATGLVKFEVNDEIGTVLYADVKDGQAVLSGLLEAGNYTVVATYMGDDRFNTNITYKEFAVIGHVKKDTPITVGSDVSGYKVTISVAVDSGATGFVRLQIGDTIANVELENGTGTYTTTLPAGSYYVQATYLGDEDYNTNSTQTAFTITEPAKQNTPIGLEIAIDENKVLVNASVDKSASGLVKFQVFNKGSGENQSLYVDVENGEAIAPLVFEKGNYTIIATYIGDDVFNSNATSKDFEIIGHVMKDTSITAQADVNGYKVTVTVDVDDDATGFAKLQIGDTIVNIELENGTGTYITTLPAGSYNVDVTYLGDENYNANATNLAFNILDQVKENTPISLDVETVENTAIFTVNVDKDATGLVKFEVNDEMGTVLYVDVKDGQTVLSGLLDAGNYTVVATYLGDARFNTNITYKDFTVIGHLMKDTPITAQADVSGYKVTVTVAVDVDATGFVRLQIGDAIVNVELENGTGTYTTTLPAGSYYVKADYLGDENYNTNSTQIAFTVTDPVKENTTIGLNVLINENEVIFNVTVNELATGLVKLQIFGRESGKNETVYLDVENGVAESDYVIANGNYTIIATYLGDDVFNSNTTSKDFEVIGHVMKDTPITAKADVNGYKVTITADVDSNATGFVEIKYGDTLVYVALENGTGTYVTTLPAGSYNVDVTYIGDENYNANATNLAFNVVNPVKENTTISIDVSSVENNVVFTVDVNLNASGIVRFEVYGAEVYVVYSDVLDGVAVMNDILEAGDYTVVATYMGDDRFNSNLTSESFTVKGHVKKDAPISADAKVNGNKVTVTVNVDENATGFVGLKQSGSTIYVALENGVATYTDVLPAGSYNVEVTYVGDDNFNENSTKVLFTVVEAAKENTTIAANVSVVDGNVTFIVFVNENATGIVKFDVAGANGSTVLYVDVVSGKAVLEGVSKSGNYTLVATYMGDERFNSNVTSVDFTVSVPEKQDTNVSISIPSDIKPGDNATVEVSIPNATGNVSVIVDGKETVVPLVNGSASVLLDNISAGNHSVVVIYSGDETHAPAHSAFEFNVPEVPVVVKAATEFAEIVVSSDKITVVLKDSQGKAVSGAVISYAIGGVSNTTVTDENGTFTIDIVSKSVVLISYAGNDSLLGTNTSIVVDSVVETKLACEFNVTEGVSIKTYAVDLKAGEIGCVEYFKLTDSNGNPIANATIKFAYKAVILNRTTDENGIVYLGINTYVAQTALCAMSYLGNEKYNATFVAFSFDIQLKPISITAKAKTFKKSTKTKKYTVTLKTQKCNSRDGKVYLSSGKKVTLKVNGKTYTAKTNSKGQATFKITKLAKKGKYTAVIKFAGDKTYKSASKKVKITIK